MLFSLHQSPRRSLFAAALCALLPFASLSPAAASAQPVAPAPEYNAAGAGELYSSQAASHPVAQLSSASAPRAQTFTYGSTRSDGLATTVSGTLFEPTAPWRGTGERPTIIFGPGTRGQGDQCAPSRAFDLVGGLAPGPAQQPTLNLNYEYPFFQIAAEQGIRVVVTDYVGLGTPGHHTYVNNIEAAHALLDGARAGLALSGAPATAPVGFAGYSQGGGAAAAAAEYAQAYAPELNVKGTYAGAPPADLPVVMAAVDGSAIVHVLGYAINGFAERDAQFREILLDNLNPRGIQFLRSASGACIGDSIATWGFTPTTALTKTGESFAQLINREPATARVLEGQRLGWHRPNAPILVANSPTDDLIPYEQARTMAGQFCQLGATVQFEAASGTDVIPGAAINHAVPLIGSVPRGLGYLIERFNDVPAPTNCE
ncbi:lipase family protein [Corynebacterium flavescens]